MGFYLMIAGLAPTGRTTARLMGLFPIVYGGSTEALPAELATFAPHLAHGFIALMLVALIALHIAAALYQQAVLKDGLLRRMWFGKRTL